MTDLRAGFQIMHNGHAVELLYRKHSMHNAEIWRVKLLFVKPEEKDELFEPHETVSFIHSKRRAA